MALEALKKRPWLGINLMPTASYTAAVADKQDQFSDNISHGNIGVLMRWNMEMYGFL